MGPEIDVGPEMTANIVKANVEVVHRLTYRGLKEDWKSNQTRISLRNEFDNSVIDKLGPDISLDEFPEMSIWRISPCMRCMRTIPHMCRVFWQERLKTMRTP